MNRVLYQGTEHVRTRQHGDVVEIVSLSGSLLKVPFGDLTPLPRKERPLCPLEVPFRERPRSFVNDLHLARLKWLLEASTRRRKKKLDKSTSEEVIPPERKPRGKKKQSLAEQLAALSPKGIQ